MLLLIVHGVSIAQAQEDEEVHSLVMEDIRVQDILTDFPSVELKPHYTEELDIWIYEFYHEEYGEVGLMTVSAREREILEFNFNIEKIRENKNDEEVQEEAQTWKQLVSFYLPEFSGMNLFWFSLVLVLLIAGYSQKIVSWRNVDIFLLYALCPFLVIIWNHMRVAFTSIFIITLLLFFRALFNPKISSSIKNVSLGLSTKTWLLLIVFILVLHVQTIYTRGIGDAGIWSCIGAEYLKQAGNLPYGREFGPNCVYGPLMYVLFVPGNIIFPPDVEFSEDGHTVQWGNYDGFDMRSVQTTVFILDLLTLWMLYLIGLRYQSRNTGFLLVFVYAMSPYILGIMGEMGLERASHVVGTPFILATFLWCRHPIFTGFMLGIGSGMLYYPVFLFALWCIHYARAYSMRDAIQFFAAFACVGLLCFVFLMIAVQPENDAGMFASIYAFMDDAIMQQQFKDGYGNSPMSFWGQYPALAVWGKPLTGILFILFACLIGLHREAKKELGLWSFSVAVLIGTQLVLSFAGGTYIGFYLAPLIIVLFANTCIGSELADTSKLHLSDYQTNCSC